MDDDSLQFLFLRRCFLQLPTPPPPPSPLPEATTLVQRPPSLSPTFSAGAVESTSSLRPLQLLIRLKMRLGTFLSCENDIPPVFPFTWHGAVSGVLGGLHETRRMESFSLSPNTIFCLQSPAVRLRLLRSSLSTDFLFPRQFRGLGDSPARAGHSRGLPAVAVAPRPLSFLSYFYKSAPALSRARTCRSDRCLLIL